MSGKGVIGARARVVVAGLIMGAFAALLAGLWNPLPFWGKELAPSPWRVAKVQGGTAFRLAMVHDVLHERYLRHGPAWYAARNVQAQKVIDGAKGESAPAVWEAMDDLAVGLERLGQGEQAVQVMRRKLHILPKLKMPATQPTPTGRLDPFKEVMLFASLPPLTPLAHHYYTAHANLGTSLIHASIARAIAGDVEAKLVLREGLAQIERAIAINPVAHFGRERWQAIAVRHLLTAIDRPEFWTKYDLCGDPLVAEPEKVSSRYPPGYAARHLRGQDLDDLETDRRASARLGIPLLSADEQWCKALGDAYQLVPFDEPTLGLIGMWTMGGGPNPLSALTLGQIMERIDQPHIAFTAYQRALEMKDRLGPTAEINETLAAYCAQRQESIAKAQQPSDPAGWMKQVRATHDEELAWGRKNQQEYHEFEASQIAAGVALDDPHFYEAFYKGRAEIASDPGLADDMYVGNEHAGRLDILPLALVGSGIGMLLAIASPEKRR